MWEVAYPEYSLPKKKTRHLDKAGVELLDILLEGVTDDVNDAAACARTILLMYQGSPMTPAFPQLLLQTTSVERVRAIADELLQADVYGLTGVTFAAAVAETDEETIAFLEHARDVGVPVHREWAYIHDRIGEECVKRLTIPRNRARSKKD